MSRSSTCLSSAANSARFHWRHGTLHTEHVQDLVKIVHLRPGFKQSLDSLVWALDGLGDLINILGLDNGLKIIFQDFGEVICLHLSDCGANRRTSPHTLQLGTPEVFQDLLPIGWVFISSKIRLQLAAQDLQCRALPNAVCADQT